MALSNEQQVRFSVYGFLGFIILVAGYFYFQIIEQSTNLSEEMNAANDNRAEYLASDSSVLETKKFKDLKPVIVPAVVTNTIPVSDLSVDQLAKLPRNSYPFCPSF